ncbi:MAG: hypothetical protein V4501_03050 [Pseudomonadota bacterium]
MFQSILKLIQLLSCALIIFSGGLLISSHFVVANLTSCRIVEKNIEAVHRSPAMCYTMKFKVEYVIKKQYFFKITYPKVSTITYDSPDPSKPNSCGTKDAMTKQLSLYPTDKVYPCWYASAKYASVLKFEKPQIPLEILSLFKSIFAWAVIALIVVRIML